MKKIIFVLALLVLAVSSAYGAQVLRTLLSAETGTATGTAISLGNAYQTFTIDVKTLGTGTVVVRVDCNGSNDSVFDTSGLGTAITCGSLKCTQVYNSQPMLQCRGVITSATGTNSTTVNLLGVP